MTSYSDLYRNRSSLDFVPLWKKAHVISAVLVLVSILALTVRGLNLGIDFEGGTAWDVPSADVSVAEVRDVLRPLGEADAKIQIVGGTDLRVQSQTTDTEKVSEIRGVLAELSGGAESEIGLTTVGPSWGDEITEKAIRALGFFFIAIAIYISVRLEWKMAVAALIALLHDILITVGMYALFQFEVTPATVIAFLTILGYSLYDTVVVFDKVKENDGRVGNRLPYREMVSRSMNQVLMRSVNTTITSVLPVLSLLLIGAFLLGAVTLREFAIALLIGLLAGAFSSMFVAAPFLAWFKEKEPELAQIRGRADARSAPSSGATIDLADAPSDSSDDAATGSPSAAGSVSDAPAPKGTTESAAGSAQKKGKARSSAAVGAGGDEAVSRAMTGSGVPRPRKKKRRR